MTEENIIYVARLHWIMFAWPVVFICVALGFGAYWPAFQGLALIFLGFALVWLILNWFTYQYCSLTIKKQHLILRSGFLVRYTTDIPFNKIESMDIRQSITGSVFGYGSLLIKGTGGTTYFMHLIDKPLTCRRYIEQWMQDVNRP